MKDYWDAACVACATILLTLLLITFAVSAIGAVIGLLYYWADSLTLPIIVGSTVFLALAIRGLCIMEF